MIGSAAEFGALVRENGKRLGWTQAELAVRCGAGERFIADLERTASPAVISKSRSSRHGWLASIWAI
jgi:HTH-type transcriptional regulator/antitoxin HipB